VAAVYALRERHRVEPLLLLVVLVLFAGMSAVPAGLGTNPHNAGPRYYFLPFVLLSWLLIYLWRENLLLPSPARAIAGVVVATSMLGILTAFSRSPDSTTGRLDWEHEILTCAASDARLVKVPVYYDGSSTNLWSMSMTRAECRRLTGGLWQGSERAG
jgi:peptidoglycan/LPS O-acetylase OafA/YrhL